MISPTDPPLFVAKMMKSQSTDAFDLYANPFETLLTAKELFFGGEVLPPPPTFRTPKVNHNYLKLFSS